MRRFGLLSIIALVPLLLDPVAHAQQGDAEQAVMDRLAGSWRLVWFDSINEDGEAVRRPYTVGRISYYAEGLMAAQLMPDDWGGDTDAGYIAYFGAVSVDLPRQAVLHHVEGAYNSNMLGQSMPRYYTLSDDDNTLTLEVRSNGRTTARLRWERINTN